MAFQQDDEDDVLYAATPPILHDSFLTRDRRLAPDTLDALREFYADREAQQAQFNYLRSRQEMKPDKDTPLTMEYFSEDWNASQFWVGT